MNHRGRSLIFWLYLADLRQLYPCVVVPRSTMDDEQRSDLCLEASGAAREKGR